MSTTSDTFAQMDAEQAMCRLRGVRAILGRLAISAEQAGDSDEDLMLKLLEDVMLDAIDALDAAIGGGELGTTMPASD